MLLRGSMQPANLLQHRRSHAKQAGHAPDKSCLSGASRLDVPHCWLPRASTQPADRLQGG